MQRNFNLMDRRIRSIDGNYGHEMEKFMNPPAFGQNMSMSLLTDSLNRLSNNYNMPRNDMGRNNMDYQPDFFNDNGGFNQRNFNNGPPRNPVNRNPLKRPSDVFSTSVNKRHMGPPNRGLNNSRVGSQPYTRRSDIKPTTKPAIKAITDPTDPQYMHPEMHGFTKAERKRFRAHLIEGLKPKEARAKIEEHKAHIQAKAKDAAIHKELFKNVTLYYGVPGSRDDPLKKNLTGSGLKWYLRYLAMGFGPRAAYQRVNERKQKPEGGDEEFHLPADKNIQDIDIFCDQILSPDDLKVAIRCKNKKIKITPEMTPQIEDAIMEELILSRKSDIQFTEKILFCNLLIIKCANKESFDWLKQIVPNLKNVTPLICRMEKYMPRYHTMELVLPDSKGKAPEHIFCLMEAQNKGLYTQKWVVQEQLLDDNDIIMKVTIDHVAAVYLVHNDKQIKYRFGMVEVSGLDNIAEVPITLTTDEEEKNEPEGETETDAEGNDENEEENDETVEETKQNGE